MKIIHEKNYEYIGQCGIYHMFRRRVDKFDKEMVLLERARYDLLNGERKYFDPVSTVKVDAILTETFTK